MARIRHELNTIYISGRLQESLRPVSRCALTAVVAPMGYGKTTAVNWFLAREAPPHCIRISVYSAHLAILWRSAQEAFAHAGLSHSEIPGSKVICTSPELIAAYHVLHRLREPRHPPCALVYFPYSFAHTCVSAG